MVELTDEEYLELSDSYAKDAPELSGNPGLLTRLREAQLVNDLLEPDFARAVNAKAEALSVPQSAIIQEALRNQMSAA
ncbi:MAG: hypothetical protein LBJ48_05385 [Coriobacteriales bacterium]|jgi:hypothetical protein|nr:hypothetical protein [Coriobacteriales bacterium]